MEKIFGGLLEMFNLGFFPAPMAGAVDILGAIDCTGSTALYDSIAVGIGTLLNLHK